MTFVLILGVVVPFASNLERSHAAGARPAIVENGSNVVTYHFPNNVESSVAFAPDGSSFAIVRDGVVRIAPNGTESFLTENEPPKKTGEPSIVYSNGFLWFNVYHGIAREKPDGTDHRYFQFGKGTSGFDQAGALAAAPDGVYFQINKESDVYPYGVRPFIGHIDSSFKLTTFQVAETLQDGNEQLIWSPDNHLDYIGSADVYDQKTASYQMTTYMYQLQADGSSTLLGQSNVCAPAGNVVSSLGALYFAGSTIVGGQQINLGTTICRASVHGNINQLSPLRPSAYNSVATDDQGNIWTANLFGAGLYAYNIFSKTVSGPENTDGLGVGSEFLYVGPDQNVYFFSVYGTSQLIYGAYVRHQMMVTPNSIDLNSLDNASIEFFVSEPVKGGAPWMVRSLDPSIATVTPASSLVGRFHVSEVRAGNTTLVLTDALGNVSYLAVTSN